jgi:hypothetical protein
MAAVNLMEEFTGLMEMDMLALRELFGPEITKAIIRKEGILAKNKTSVPPHSVFVWSCRYGALFDVK